jgi:REP element-mobilizing transposase RayT
MRHRLYCHLVWTTRNRQPLIDVATATFLERYLRTVATRLDAEVVEIGIVRTHVHVLARVPPTTSIPVLVQSLKGGSATVANREVRTNGSGKLAWAEGYSASSVSEVALDRVRRYVRRQAEHHPNEAIPGYRQSATQEGSLRVPG